MQVFFDFWGYLSIIESISSVCSSVVSIDRPVGLSGCQSVHRSVGPSVRHSVSLSSVSQPVSKSVGRSIGQSVSQPVGQSGREVDRQTGRQADRQTVVILTLSLLEFLNKYLRFVL